MTQTAKLFMNGRSQAVRLPSEFRFPGREVSIRKDPETGDIILSSQQQATRQANWEEFFRLLDEPVPINEDFLLDRDCTPPTPRDLF